MAQASRTYATQLAMSNEWLEQQGLVSFRDLWIALAVGRQRDELLHPTIRDRFFPALAEEQPGTRPIEAEVAPQHGQQSRRQADVALLAALGLAHPDPHRVALDVAGLQVRQLAQPQADQPVLRPDQIRTFTTSSSALGAVARVLERAAALLDGALRLA